MPRVPFEDLPDHGRLWVFPASRALSDVQAEGLLREVDAFLDGWAAHGVPLRSARGLRENRFLLVGVDVDAEAPSGCSIDALVNRLRALGGELDVSVIDHSRVWFRDGADIRSVVRKEFRALVEAREVDEATAVFDTSLTSIEALRAGKLELPAGESWHGRAFFKTPSGA